MLKHSFRLGILLTLLVPALSACPSKKTEAPAAPPPAAPSAAAPAPAAPPAEAKPAAEAPKAEAAPSAATSGNFSTPTDAVKTFYEAVNNETYDIAWSSLTQKSQAKIVDMVATDEKLDASAVKNLFDTNDAAIRKGFWSSFKNSSKVSEFAPGAVYKVTSDKGDMVVVELTNKLVTLDSKAFKENGQWKLGYIETFLDK